MFVWAKIRTWDLRSIYMGWFSPYEVEIGLSGTDLIIGQFSLGAYHDVSAVIFISPKNCQEEPKMSIINRNSPVVQKGPQNWPIQPCDVSWYICCNGTLSPIQGADGRCKPLDICLLSLFFLWKKNKVK